MLKCPKCNKEISDIPGSRCPRCKRRIRPKDVGHVVCPEPGCKAVLPKTAIYCPKCGAKIRNEGIEEKVGRVARKIEKILDSL